MTKMGRPKKKKADRREGIIHFRVSADESKVMEAAAGAAGQSLSNWARSILLSAAGHGKVSEGVGIEPHRRVSGES
jgi:hypothetical protein